MQPTLSKIKALEKFIRKHGEDAFISQTVSKLLGYKIQTYLREINEIDAEVKPFEQKYRMSSSEFFEKFQKGDLGDDMDFVEWSALYQIRNNILQKKKELEASDD